MFALLIKKILIGVEIKIILILKYCDKNWVP